MEDLEKKMERLLADPQAMERVQGLLASLQNSTGNSEPKPAPAPVEASSPTLDSGALPALLGNLLGGKSEPQPTPTPAGGLPDLGALSSLLPTLLGGAGSGGGQDAALLRALRPYLHGEREKRVDDALRLLQLSQLLPLLKS